MRILVIPDSFKDSISAFDFNGLFSQVVAENRLNWNVTYIPMADGGEGTLDFIQSYLELQEISIKAS